MTQARKKPTNDPLKIARAIGSSWRNDDNATIDPAVTAVVKNKMTYAQAFIIWLKLG